ncbi:MAG: sigma-70 family RNA polymerase sigma factor [Pseudomonadota bacterium]
MEAAYAHHRPVLAAFLAQRLARQEDVEEILQEAFARALDQEKRQEVHSPRAYLFIVARNLLSRKLRRQSRTVDSEVSQACLKQAPCGERPPEDQAHQRLKLEALQQAVDGLPTQCRRVFLLRKVNGASQKQIARRLNISVSTVERHITNAMTRLRAALSAQGYNPRSGLVNNGRSVPKRKDR